MINLDHPCKQTCSGWKQGYERGMSQASMEVEALKAQIKEANEIIMKLEPRDDFFDEEEAAAVSKYQVRWGWPTS